MKQHITKNQIDELSESQRVKIDNWGIAHDYWDRGDLPVVNIGQMIEFLDEHYKTMRITKGQHTYREGISPHYKWELVTPRIPSDCYPPFQQENELCDALWEAVKEILESKAST